MEINWIKSWWNLITWKRKIMQRWLFILIFALFDFLELVEINLHFLIEMVQDIWHMGLVFLELKHQFKHYKSELLAG